MVREMKGNWQEGMTVAEIVCILNLNGRALGGSDEAFPLLNSASSMVFSGGATLATLATLATVLTLCKCGVRDH